MGHGEVSTGLIHGTLARSEITFLLAKQREMICRREPPRTATPPDPNPAWEDMDGRAVEGDWTSGVNATFFLPQPLCRLPSELRIKMCQTSISLAHVTDWDVEFRFPLA
ncbi:unnamed protein product [Caretta caretta]